MNDVFGKRATFDGEEVDNSDEFPSGNDRDAIFTSRALGDEGVRYTGEFGDWLGSGRKRGATGCGGGVGGEKDAAVFGLLGNAELGSGFEAWEVAIKRENSKEYTRWCACNFTGGLEKDAFQFVERTVAADSTQDVFYSVEN